MLTASKDAEAFRKAVLDFGKGEFEYKRHPYSAPWPKEKRPAVIFLLGVQDDLQGKTIVKASKAGVMAPRGERHVVSYLC